MEKRSTGQRLQLALSLVIVILIVFATNRIDQYHFEKVQEITRSVYEDRLVALGYIYELDQHFDDKRQGYAQLWSEAIGEPDNRTARVTAPFMGPQRKINSLAEELMQKYATTRLTPDEAAYFEKLQRSYGRLKSADQKMIDAGTYELTEIEYDDLQEVFSNLKIYLNQLAEIQQGEGRRMTEIAQESLNQNAFMSQIEIILVIVVGIALQVVLFYRKW
jgi:hypothetical protein